MSSSRKFIAAAACCTALAILSPTAPANAAPLPLSVPSGLGQLSSQADDQVLRTQNLSPTWEVLSSLPGFVDGGYQSEQSTILQVKWNGRLSSEAISAIRAAEDRGRQVQVSYVPMSLAHAQAAVDKLDAALAAKGFNVWSSQPTSDYAGIQIAGPNLSISQTEEVNRIGRSVIGKMPVSIIPWDPAQAHPGTFEAWPDGNRAAADTVNEDLPGVRLHPLRR
jgi:hypothetical protein